MKKQVFIYFFFSINVFWGVDSKSGIHFIRLVLENSDNPENLFYPDYRGFPVLEEKNGLQNRILHVKKPFINASLIQEITANPKINSS